MEFRKYTIIATSILGFIIIIMVLCSCKKKANNNSSQNTATNYRVAVIDYATSSLKSHYRIVYNSDNKIDSIVKTGDLPEVRTFNYSDTICLVSVYSDGYITTFTMDMNANGLIAKIIQSDTQWMYYTGTELTSGADNDPGGNFSTGYSVWSNGDLDTGWSDNHTSFTTYTYDTTMTPIYFPIDVIDFLMYGQSFTMTKHLIKDISGYTWTYNYLYNFDAKGRVSQMQMVFGDTTTYMFTY